MNLNPASQPNALAEPTASAHNSPRYFAWLYSSPESRLILQALLALEAEIPGVLRPGIDHRVAHVRLEWWREESERLTAGHPVHPLTRALPAGVSIEGLIATTVWDLASATFGTRAEVTGYCERWATTMTQPLASYELTPRAAHAARAAHLAPASERPAPQADAAAESLAPHNSPITSKRPNEGGGASTVQRAGIAIGAVIREIELLSTLASEARAGRLRLPLDELEQAGVDAGALAKTPWPAKLCAVLQARHRELRAGLAAHTSALPREHQSAARGLLVWAALASRQSLRAEKALPQEAAAGAAVMLADGFQAWRSARRAQNGTFRIS